MNADAIKNCKTVGIMSHCSFMIGLPTETLKELNDTVRFIKSAEPDLGGAGIFHPFPQTLRGLPSSAFVNVDRTVTYVVMTTVAHVNEGVFWNRDHALNLLHSLAEGVPVIRVA